MCVRAAKDLAMQHPGHVDVGTKSGATRHLVYAVVTDGTCAHDLELSLALGFFIGGDGHLA
jgi:hypothetical protein